MGGDFLQHKQLPNLRCGGEGGGEGADEDMRLGLDEDASTVEQNNEGMRRAAWMEHCYEQK